MTITIPGAMREGCKYMVPAETMCPKCHHIHHGAAIAPAAMSDEPNWQAAEQWVRLAEAFDRSAQWLDRGLLEGSARTHPLVGTMDYRLAADGLRLFARHLLAAPAAAEDARRNVTAAEDKFLHGAARDASTLVAPGKLVANFNAPTAAVTAAGQKFDVHTFDAPASPDWLASNVNVSDAQASASVLTGRPLSAIKGDIAAIRASLSPTPSSEEEPCKAAGGQCEWPTRCEDACGCVYAGGAA